jgi:hypothetical protein
MHAVMKLQSSTNRNQNLLREYGQLLDDYKDLKKAFETKSSKSVARATAVPKVPVGKHCNSYVLVLVDGNGYIVSFLR